jgi:hypothetical protein
VAERDGRIDAALSLSNGAVMADPFRHTAQLCDLLRIHAHLALVVRDASHRRLPREQPRLATA